MQHSAQTDVAVSNEANKTVVRRLFEEAFNQGELSVVDELWIPDGLESGKLNVAGRTKVESSTVHSGRQGGHSKCLESVSIGLRPVASCRPGLWATTAPSCWSNSTLYRIPRLRRRTESTESRTTRRAEEAVAMAPADHQTPSSGSAPDRYADPYKGACGPSRGATLTRAALRRNCCVL